MSSLVISTGYVQVIQQLRAAGIRTPDSVGFAGSVATLTWTPDLAAADQTTANDIATLVKFSVDMTLAEWQSVKADAAGLKNYLGVPSPTLAQTSAATAAIIRILAVIVRA